MRPLGAQRVVSGEGEVRTLDRVSGALYGAVIGDAVGAPTRFLSPARARHAVPDADTFLRGPGRPGAARTVTKNGELVPLMAELLLEGGGRIDKGALARRLKSWATDETVHLDPGILTALRELEDGVDPRFTGRTGDTNGCLPAAVVVGVATPPAPLETLVDRVEEACELTHNTGLAIAGAAALAAAVSEGVEGSTFARAAAAGEEAAQLGAERGHYTPGASVAERIDSTLQFIATSDATRALRLVSDLVGLGSHVQETIPVAFALALLWPDDPWRVCVEAARMGGDSSAIGAGGAAIAGSLAGVKAFPGSVVTLVTRANRLNLRTIARRLLRLRESRRRPTPLRTAGPERLAAG